MSTPAPIGGGIDVDVPPDFPEGGLAAIPYNRSGTQIFEQKDKVKGNMSEGLEDEPDIVITDELLEQMWDEYNKDPNFFKQIEIAQDGGFSEVDELIGGMRYVTAGMTISFVLINLYSLISIDIGLIQSVSDANATDLFLVTTDVIIAGLPGSAEDSTGIVRLLKEFAENDKLILAYLSLLMISVYVGRMLLNTFQILCPSSEMGKWVGVQELFWNSLPEAATISEVKLLNYVTPAVVLPALTQTLTTAEGGCGARCTRILWFLVTRVLAAIVGFDAFLFKLQTVSQAMIMVLTVKDEATDVVMEKDLGFWDYLNLLALSGAFLNQMLGIVQLGWFVRKRIFAFIFAGEDGQLSAEEEALKETWESMLAQRIWMDLPPKQAIVAYLSYSDFDFQKLALETVKPGAAEKKDKPISERRKLREQMAASGRETELVNQS